MEFCFRGPLVPRFICVDISTVKEQINKQCSYPELVYKVCFAYEEKYVECFVFYLLAFLYSWGKKLVMQGCVHPGCLSTALT